MPGAQDRWDQLTEPGAATQGDHPHASDRPERGSVAELRLRLERLPAGHPSSPYHDDLTRKPPVTRLKDLELPLTGYPAASNGSGHNGAGGRAPVTEESGAESWSTTAGPAGTRRTISTASANSIPGTTSTPGGNSTVSWSGPAYGDSAPGGGTVAVGGAMAPGRRAANGNGTTIGRGAAESLSAAAEPGPDGDFGADRDVGGNGDPGTHGEFTAPDIPGASDHFLAPDPLRSGSHFPARDIAAASDHLPAPDLLGAGDHLPPPDLLGAGGHFPAGDTPGTGHHFPEDDPLGALPADDPLGALPADDPLGALPADDPLGALPADDPPSPADEPGPDPAGSAWLSAPSWDGPPDRDRAAEAGWADPEPGADTLTQAIIDTEPDRPADPPRRGADGSWAWNGRYLTGEECRIAEEALGRYRVAEGRNVFGSYGHSGLTPAMRRVEAQLEHGQLLPDTESHALKPPDRFKERLADLILRHPDKPADELSAEVHDGIRYAFIFDPEQYAEATLQAHSRLKGHGFELEARWNGWESREYKGINSRWRDPAHDLVFEVQFHTAPSWAAWQRTRPAYKQIADPRTPPAQRARLRAMHAAHSASVPVPPRCTAIPDFRKEVQ